MSTPTLRSRKSVGRRGSKATRLLVELASVHKSIKEERQVLYEKGTDYVLRGYALSELRAIENALLLNLEEKQNLIDTLDREIQREADAKSEGNTNLEMRLKAKLEYFEQRLETQRIEELAKTDQLVVSSRQMDTILRQLEREQALLRHQALAKPVSRRPVDARVRPETVTPVADTDVARRDILVSQPVWEVAESLRGYTCPHDERMWTASTIRSLLVDTRTVATKHARFMPWSTTVPLYLYTYQFSREIIWVRSSQGMTDRVWTLADDMQQLEAVYSSRGFTYDDTVFASHGEAYGIEWFTAAMPDGNECLARYCKPHVASRDDYTDPLSCTTLWMCSGPLQCPVSPSILEYIYSRPPDEVLDFSHAPEGHRWSVVPYQHKGVQWILGLCDKSTTPDVESASLAKAIEDAVLREEPSTAVTVTCERFANMGGLEVEATLNTALESFNVKVGEAIDVTLPSSCGRVEHPLSFVRAWSEGEGVGTVDDAYVMLGLSEPSLIIAVASKMFTAVEVREQLNMYSANITVHCIISDDGDTGLGTVFMDNRVMPHSGITLLGIKDPGAHVGTSFTCLTSPSDLVAAVKNAAESAGWTRAAPPPMLTLINSPTPLSEVDITEAVQSVFGATQSLLITKGRTEHLQATVLWLSHPAEVTHHLLSPFKYTDKAGLITACEDGYILTINGKPAGEEYNRWCETPEGIVRHYLEVAIEAEGVRSLEQKKVVILPQGVTQKGALRVAEKVSKGQVRCCCFDDPRTMVTEAVLASPLQRSEVKAALLFVPSLIPEESVRDLIQAVQTAIPGVPIIGGHTYERYGQWVRRSSIMSSALPLLILFGAPPALQKELSTPPNIELSVVANSAFLGKARITVTPAMLAATHRYDVPITTTRKSFTVPEGMQPSVTLLLESKAETCPSIDPRILEAVFAAKVTQGATCHSVTPNDARDFLSLQIFTWQVTGKTYLLSLSGATPLMVDLSIPLPPLSYALVDGVGKEKHKCRVCGLGSLHVMPRGFCVEESGKMMCCGCAFGCRVIRLARVPSPCTYQMSEMIENAFAAQGTSNEHSLPTVRSAEKEYLLNELDHNGDWPLSYSGTPVLGDMTLFGWPLEMLSPFVAALNNALLAMGRGGERLTFRVVRSDGLRDAGYREGGVVRWSGFSEGSRHSCTTADKDAVKVFSIQTNVPGIRSISQWSRTARAHTALFPLHTCFLINKIDAFGYHAHEVPASKATNIVKRTKLLDSGRYTTGALISLV